LAKSKEALQAALEATEHSQTLEPVEDFALRLAEPISEQDSHNKRHKKGKGKAVDDSHSGWQGIQPLQKLHNLAVWLRSSAIHSDTWRRDVGLSLGIDNATRWNSWYHVLNNAMEKRSQINEFLLNHDQELADVTLSSSDWDLLKKTHQFLEPFAEATQYGQGDHSSVAATLDLMDVLLMHYEKAKLQHKDDTRMLKAIEMGWFVLDKYYTKTEDTPVYAASVLLHPSKRMAYLQKNWDKRWHDAAISGATSLWTTGYQSLAVSSQPEPFIPLPKKANALANLFQLTAVEMSTVEANQDDIKAFMDGKPIPFEGTPLQWWSRLEQRSQYPRLSQMAIDIFSIPAESAEPERAFSGARRTASWDRLSMSCQNLEKVECIGSWLREGLIVPSVEGGLGLICSPEPVDIDTPVDPALEEM
jgi:hypothetical protein